MKTSDDNSKHINEKIKIAKQLSEISRVLYDKGFHGFFWSNDDVAAKKGFLLTGLIDRFAHDISTSRTDHYFPINISTYGKFLDDNQNKIVTDFLIGYHPERGVNLQNVGITYLEPGSRLLDKVSFDIESLEDIPSIRQVREIIYRREEIIANYPEFSRRIEGDVEAIMKELISKGYRGMGYGISTGDSAEIFNINSQYFFEAATLFGRFSKVNLSASIAPSEQQDGDTIATFRLKQENGHFRIEQLEVKRISEDQKVTEKKTYPIHKVQDLPNIERARKSVSTKQRSSKKRGLKY